MSWGPIHADKHNQVKLIHLPRFGPYPSKPFPSMYLPECLLIISLYLPQLHPVVARSITLLVKTLPRRYLLNLSTPILNLCLLIPDSPILEINSVHAFPPCDFIPLCKITPESPMLQGIKS